MAHCEEMRLSDIHERIEAEIGAEESLEASKFHGLVEKLNKEVNLNKILEGVISDSHRLFMTTECVIKVGVKDEESVKELISKITGSSNTVPEITHDAITKKTTVKTTVLHEEVCKWIDNLQGEDKDTFDVFVPPKTGINAKTKLIGVRLNITIGISEDGSIKKDATSFEEVAYRHVLNIIRRAPDSDTIIIIRDKIQKETPSSTEILKDAFEMEEEDGLQGIDNILLSKMRSMW
jgi:hypothetical protein